MKLALLIIFVVIINTINAQTAPTNFGFSTRQSTQYNYSVNGWGTDYPTGNTYNMYFGYTSAGVTSDDVLLSQFQIGSNMYYPITLPNGECYDAVKVNRVANASVSDLDKQTLFFVKASTSGSNLYFSPSYTSIQEAVNTRIMDRGGDNVFNNLAGHTVNNIERIDLLINSGVFSPDNTKAGFLINERGGNDDFKAAAITALDANGNVSALGTLVSAGSTWGNTGRGVVTTVLQRDSNDTYMRPSQNLTSQNIYGTYISFADLGISSNTPIYGIAIFPGDVTSSMDLIGLTDVPTNTSDNNRDGGLDLMGGGGFFSADDNQVVDLQVTLESSNLNPTVNSPVNITVTADNNGPFVDDSISIIINLPDNYTYNDVQAGYIGTVVKSGNTVTWKFPNLLYKEQETLVIELTALTEDLRSFTSSISGDKTDVVPGNNTDELSLKHTDPLPVELISFSGERNNENVSLYWTTASETNNDFFEIQRSVNSVDFYATSKVQGAGNSNKKINYYYTELNDDSKLYYYRLKQVDFDGKYSFSNIIAIAGNSTKNITVYPNPSFGNITIRNIEPFQVISIINSSGQILQQLVSTSENLNLNLGKWGNGIYYISIQGGNNVKTQRVIIQ